MISLYILLIASIIAIFGLFVTIFAHVKKIDRELNPKNWREV